MNHITETVDLPDPSVQPLVHPLDLPDARRAYRKAWLIRCFANPAACLCLAAIVWFLSESWVPPLFVFAATLGFGWMASRWSTREAWEFIPRKRQDRARALPVAFSLMGAAILAVLLGAAIVLLGLRLARPDVSDGVREVVFGGGLAVCVISVLAIVIELIRRHRPPWTVIIGLIPVGGVVIAVAIGSSVMFAGQGTWSWSNVGIGAAIIVVAAIGTGAWKLIEQHSRAQQSEAAQKPEGS